MVNSCVLATLMLLVAMARGVVAGSLTVMKRKTRFES